MELLGYVVVLLPIAIGFPAGVIAFKINYVFNIALGKLWSKGNAQKRFIPAGSGFAIFYDIIIESLEIDYSAIFDMLPQKFANQISKVIAAIFFALFGIGVKHASKQLTNTDNILMAIIRRTVVAGNSPEEREIRDETLRNLNSKLDESMEESRREAFKVLIIAFNSTLMVFFISLRNRKCRICPFIKLRPEEQLEYVEMWNNNRRLKYAIQELLNEIKMSYRLSLSARQHFHYGGTLLGRSYWK